MEVMVNELTQSHRAHAHAAGQPPNCRRPVEHSTSDLKHSSFQEAAIEWRKIPIATQTFCSVWSKSFWLLRTALLDDKTRSSNSFKDFASSEFNGNKAYNGCGVQLIVPLVYYNHRFARISLSQNNPLGGPDDWPLTSEEVFAGLKSGAQSVKIEIFDSYPDSIGEQSALQTITLSHEGKGDLAPCRTESASLFGVAIPIKPSAFPAEMSKTVFSARLIPGPTLEPETALRMERVFILELLGSKSNFCLVRKKRQYWL
jgi:hypothetical protein